MGYGDDLMALGEVEKAIENDPTKEYNLGDGKREYCSPILIHSRQLTPQSASIRWPMKQVRWSSGRFRKFQPLEDGGPVTWIHNYKGNRPYIDYSRTTRHQFAFKRNVHPHAGDLTYTGHEQDSWLRALMKANLVKDSGECEPFVILEPHVKGTVSSSNKRWPLKRWQQVVDYLVEDVELNVVQFDTGNVMLRGATPLRVRTYREAVGAIGHADMTISSEGGIHHAAASQRKPAVVIFGGYIAPDVTGYDFHKNLAEGGVCGKRTPCPHCTAAMNAISVDEVIEAVHDVREDFNPPDFDWNDDEE